MNEDSRIATALHITVKITEQVCSLPAVATQNWCDLAAASVLSLGESAMALVMIGQVEEHGRILRHEATGVAGSYLAQVTTTVGAPKAVPSTISMDPNDAVLSTLRASVAQGKELGWSPGKLSAGAVRVGTPADFGVTQGIRPGPLARRWDAIAGQTGSRHQLILGAASLPGSVADRLLIIETGVTAPVVDTEASTQILEATLALVARKALGAIGPDPSDGSQWLTTKEQVVLTHLLMGKSVREIAQELGRSPHTVHDHVKSLHRKLKANSRGELVAKALGHLSTFQSNEPPSTPARTSETASSGT